MSAQLCTEAEIQELVAQFYARVRADACLGPIFEAHIDDWDAHLLLLRQFWSSVLLGTGRFSGSPMTKHAQLEGLSAELFERWLGIFAEVCTAQANQAMAAKAQVMAQRIAHSLWLGWQMRHNQPVADWPSHLPRSMPIGLPPAASAAA